MNEKILKLRRVVDDPASSENEKAIARKILERYKALGHDVDIDDKREFAFAVNWKDAEAQRFFSQICANVLGDAGKGREKYTYKGEYSKTYLECTPAEHVEISEKFAFYWRDYKKQAKDAAELFRSAYIQKNRLFSTESWTDEDRKRKPPSEDELRKLRQMAGMVDRAEYLKRLGSGS